MTVPAADSFLNSGGDGDGGCFNDKYWPPGFRFHPTDEELVLYYLKRKICKKKLKLDIVRELDVYKWDPEDLPGQSKLKTGDRQWFFFTPRDRKYPNSSRSSRATRQGYWKATGKDRNIMCNSRIAGIKKTLVFYRGCAPSGGRTDWVMHEYTLDEEELKRCPDVKDYYALYKVYKKSGSGPKNGEQYGAPFKEEEWVEDETADVNIPVTPNILFDKHNARDDNVKANGQPELQLLELEDMLKELINEPPFEQPQIINYPSAVPQVTVEEEVQSTLVVPSVRDPTIDLSPSVQHHNDDFVNFDFNQPATHGLHSYKASEVTSAPNSFEQEARLCEEDFLEMDDLLNSKSNFFYTKEPSESLMFDGLSGLNELDLYHDAAMFLQDMGEPYEPVVNQLGYCLPENTAAAEVLCQQPSTEEEMVKELLLNDRTMNFPSLESDRVNTSGFLPQSNASRLGENQSGNNSDDATANTSWLSSAMWAMVDSIPSTPASAAESPLVNKALERMSSFSRLRAKALSDINASASKSERGSQGVKKFSGGFSSASVIGGVLCLIFSVLIGTVVLGKSIF